ncbi:MAG: sugar transferase [Synechococcaceae cyanobacterium]
MSWRDPRRDLLLCAGLDLLGLVLVLLGLINLRGLPLVGQSGWIATTLATYLVMGWLLGTYTVLGRPRLPRWTLLQRLGLTVLASLLVVAVLRWLLNPPLAVWVVHRSSQLSLLLPVVVWSGLVRVVLHRGALRSEEPRLLLVAPEAEAQQALLAWQRTPTRLMPRRVTPGEAARQAGPMVLAVSPTYQQQPVHRPWLEELERRDPRLCSLTTPLALAERQLERLPPALVPEPWLSYDAIPWTAVFSPQRQLKRVADVAVALLLLLATAPLMLLAALLIWLEDRGPVFYVQKRSGWLGEPFNVLKLRTMAVAPRYAPASWTVPGDRRITGVGLWLRRSRLDELPQLINVLRGDMSLIGPRPERPELERDLEASIPHYRKRHWMRPGLSGWAQVCAPYAASVEDSELKLSYDLYYLKHFSTWLDLVILLRTIKTVLKVQGR